MLRLAVANLLDRSMLDDSAAIPGIRPAGLLDGVSLTPGSGVGGVGAMATDLATLHASLQAAGVGANVVLIANSGTAAAVSVLTNGTQQVIDTPVLAPDEVVAVDTSYLVTAFGAIEIDLDGSASVSMANSDTTPPTQAMTTGGAV